MVDPHHGAVRNHVAGHATLNVHRLERLAVTAAIHHRFTVRVSLKSGQQGAQPVDRIAPHPWPCRVGPGPGEGHLKTHRSLASGLDGAGGRLAKDGDVAGQQLRRLGKQLAQAGVGNGHLLAGVEDPGHVDRWFADHAGQLQREPCPYGPPGSPGGYGPDSCEPPDCRRCDPRPGPGWHAARPPGAPRWRPRRS